MRSISATILLILFSLLAKAQVKVSSKDSAEFYVRNVLLGPGIEVANIKYRGMIGGLGQFEADPRIIGVRSGLVLSTGNVDSIKGPNNTGSYTSKGKLPADEKEKKELKRGDRDLNKLCKKRTTDVASLEFDFVPVKNKLEFNYVFASEEYPEYVGSAYNDVFGFFLEGAGMRRKTNLAIVPGTKKPVAINTVNQNKNSEWYHDNNGELNLSWFKKTFTSKEKIRRMRELHNQLQFDGFTKVLTVQYDVVPYQKYHIKIAIGDASDELFDSGVFLEAGSFVSVVDTGGKHYAVLKKYEGKQPDIDSILNRKITVSEKEETHEVVIDEQFEITDVYFDTDSYVIADSAQQQLTKLAGYLVKNPAFKCAVLGYTDSIGSKKYNEMLSEKRALAVKTYLQQKGVDAKRLDCKWGGMDNPRSANSTEKGRSRNRRVEITIEED